VGATGRHEAAGRPEEEEEIGGVDATLRPAALALPPI
jgi:hypothetical protein